MSDPVLLVGLFAILALELLKRLEREAARNAAHNLRLRYRAYSDALQGLAASFIMFGAAADEVRPVLAHFGRTLSATMGKANR